MDARFDYAGNPVAAKVVKHIVSASKVVSDSPLPATTRELVQLRVGQIVGSTYHTVQQTRNLREAGETEERITAVASWQDAPYFTDAERVALELPLVDAVLTPNPFGERVSDELFAKESAHYDDKALLTLAMAMGQSCFFIPVTLIGKPMPGKAHWKK
ncbi:carboxymuconolactone decarboxylase family protein [Nonomuraea sp. NPDC049784]|uniref:carboxymuconolactone decarboxylase family protein n=1 Tax=Nonomuraea sp. NPDC049784 TaxID=3154361 RepID=UPI0033FE11D4